MGDTTGIGWTDHTFNPWWGCSQVSAGCQHCYAASFAARYGHDVFRRSGERRMLTGAWSAPLRWNREARAAGKPARVFCASMADVFEDHPQLPEPRARLWDLIERTPWLRWQLLTKRPENIAAMVPWGDAWPLNVWAGTSVENQRYAEERIPLLAAVPARVRFLSCEPLIGPLDLRPWLCAGLIGWAIGGGESGGRRREMNLAWLASLAAQCEQAGVPLYVKQDSGPRPGMQGRIPGRLWALKQFPAETRAVDRSRL